MSRHLCPGSLRADGPCEHGEFDVHYVGSVDTGARERLAEAVEAANALVHQPVWSRP